MRVRLSSLALFLRRLFASFLARSSPSNFLVLWMLPLSACYLSHGIGESEDRDAGDTRFDAPRFDIRGRGDASGGRDTGGDASGARDGGFADARFDDTSTRDGAPRDTLAPDAFADAGPVDSGGDTIADPPIRALPCEQFLGRIGGILEWPSIDCGHVSDVQIVALADGRFLPIVTEARSCFDRPAQVLAQFMTLRDDGRYIGSEAIVLGPAGGPAYAAAFGNEVAVCSGDQIYIRAADGTVTRVSRPIGPPECPTAACRGIAHDGEGWVLITDPPECAAGNASIVRLDSSGAPREASIPLPERADAIARMSAGVEVIGSPRSGSAGRYDWPRAAAAPETNVEGGLRPDALVAGIGAWPFQDGARVIAVAHELGLFQRVLSRRGEVVFENYRTLNPREPTNVELQPTDFGLAIGLSYSPQSERGGEYIVSYIDHEGDAVYRARTSRTNAPTGRIQVDSAWSAPIHLSHTVGQLDMPLNSTRLFGLSCRER